MLLLLGVPLRVAAAAQTMMSTHPLIAPPESTTPLLLLRMYILRWLPPPPSHHPLPHKPRVLERFVCVFLLLTWLGSGWVWGWLEALDLLHDPLPALGAAVHLRDALDGSSSGSSSGGRKGKGGVD